MMDAIPSAEMTSKLLSTKPHIPAAWTHGTTTKRFVEPFDTSTNVPCQVLRVAGACVKSVLENM